MAAHYSKMELSRELAELERLSQIWSKLAVSEISCDGIGRLVIAKLKDTMSLVVITQPNITLEDFISLAAVRRSLTSVEHCWKDNITTRICMVMVKQVCANLKIGHNKTSSGTAKKSEIQQLEQVQDLLKIKNIVAESFPSTILPSGCLERGIDNALHGLQSGNGSNNYVTTIDALGICVDMLKDISTDQQAILEVIITSKVSTLQEQKPFKFKDYALDPSNQVNLARLGTPPREGEPNRDLADPEQTLESEQGGELDNNLADPEEALESEEEDESDEDWANLEEALESEQEAYAILSSAYNEDKEIYEAAKIENHKLVEIIRELEEDKTELTKINEKLTSSNTELKHDLVAKTNTAESTFEAATMKDTKIEDLTTQNAQVAEKLDETTTTLQKTRQDLDDIDEQNQSLVRGVRKLTAQNALLEKKVLDAEDKLGQSEKAELQAARYVYELKEEITSLKMKSAEATNTIAELQSSFAAENLQNITINYHSLEQQLAMVNQQLHNVRASVGISYDSDVETLMPADQSTGAPIVSTSEADASSSGEDTPVSSSDSDSDPDQ